MLLGGHEATAIPQTRSNFSILLSKHCNSQLFEGQRRTSQTTFGSAFLSLSQHLLEMMYSKESQYG